MTMWKIDIFERKQDGNRGNLKTTSKYETKEQATAARDTLRNLSRGWTKSITINKNKKAVYKMRNVIVSDPVECK